MLLTLESECIMNQILSNLNIVSSLAAKETKTRQL